MPEQLVRPFLRPAQPALFAEYLDVQPVHSPDRDRTRPQPQDRAAIHAEGYHGVVLQRAAFKARDEIGGEFARLLSRDVACHMQRVDAAIGELRGYAGLRRIVAPAHARIVGVSRVGMKPVGEFGLDETDPAKIAARHHGPHVPHQGITGITVIDGADRAGACGGGDDVFRFVYSHGHRLFAQHVDAGFEECLRDFVMRGIGCGDGDKVDPAGAVLFARQHFAPVAIRAIRRNAEPAGIFAALFRIGVERACGKIVEAVERGADAVRGPDLAAFAAADHAPVQSCHAQTSSTFTQRFSSLEIHAASISWLTSMPSSKVGHTCLPVAIAVRKSLASMMIWS